MRLIPLVTLHWENPSSLCQQVPVTDSFWVGGGSLCSPLSLSAGPVLSARLWVHKCSSPTVPGRPVPLFPPSLPSPLTLTISPPSTGIKGTSRLCRAPPSLSPKSLRLEGKGVTLKFHSGLRESSKSSKARLRKKLESGLCCVSLTLHTVQLSLLVPVYGKKQPLSQVLSQTLF